MPVPGLAGEGVGRAHEHVVAELVEVAAVAQPRAGRRDVVGRGLALGLDQHRHVEEVLAVPRRPRLHQLQPLAVRVDLQLDAAAVLGRRDVGRVAAVEVVRRHLGRGLRRVEPERLAVARRSSVSVSGLNDSRPPSAKAVTISGLAMKFIVVGWPSLRRGKLRLYEVTIVFGTASAASVARATGRCTGRRRWPARCRRCPSATASGRRARSSRAPARSPASPGTARRP